MDIVSILGHLGILAMVDVHVVVMVAPNAMDRSCNPRPFDLHQCIPIMCMDLK